jgi:nitroreductase
METSYEKLISLRSSRRSFTQKDLGEEAKAFMTGILETHSTGPLGTSIDFRLIDRIDLTDQKIRLGTYGFIQGARYFIAGQVIPSQTAFLDYGHALESIMIELTGMDLGTCWLGGTFNRGEFARAVGLKAGSVIPAVTPVGYPTARKGIGERLIRMGAGSKNRLPWQELFFDRNTNRPLTPENTSPLTGLFEAVRLAPSASNKQPWRILREDNLYRFFLQRTPGYGNKYIPVDLQVVDIGIAMSHWDLAAAEKGIRTRWIKEDPHEIPDGTEYIITSQIDD